MKPFYLDGRRIESPLVRPVLNPWSGENVADVCIARGSDVEEAVTSSMSNRVALHGPQKAEENCNRVALEPKSAAIIAAVISPLSDFTTILPRVRLCQTPYALASTSTITIGSKDSTGVVCLNGEGSATHEHSWR